MKTNFDLNFKNIELDNINTANINIMIADLFFQNINRLESTILCEMKESYVQQSQRYVKINDDSISINYENVSEYEGQNLTDIKERIDDVVKNSIKLYEKMTELKHEIKGRPKLDDFKYGINYEEARYILPLAISTNLKMSLPLKNLILFIKEHKKKINTTKNGYVQYNFILNRVYKSLVNEINSYFKTEKAVEYLLSLFPEKRSLIDEQNIHSELETNFKIYNELTKNEESNNDYVYQTERLFYNNELNNTNNNKIALGILTSTTQNPLKELSKKDKKDKEKLIERVIGYGHTSVLEQNTNVFKHNMSLLTYHQHIRERMPENYRISLFDLLDTRSYILDRISDVKDNKNYILELEPRLRRSFFSIHDTILPISLIEFKDEIRALFDKIKEIRKELDLNFEWNLALQLLLNGQIINVLTVSNSRMDIETGKKRLCFNAQKEIRMMHESKFINLFNLQNSSFYKAGLPHCITDKCEEGAYSCKNASGMQKKWETIL